MLHRPDRPRRIATVAAAALAAGGLTAAAAPANAAATVSTLKLRVPGQLTGYVFDDGSGDTSSYVDSSLFLQAVKDRFELWSHQPADYTSPVKTVLHVGSKVTTLPAGTTKTLAGLSDFLRVEIRDTSGKTIYKGTSTACLNDPQAVRVTPNGAPHSDYPSDCGYNPFALGSVQGIAKGWATHLNLFDQSKQQPSLKPGKYRVTVSISPTYRKLFGISAADGSGSGTLTMTADESDSDENTARPRVRSDAHEKVSVSRTPQGQKFAAAPKHGPRPDLAALPAWGISVSEDGNYLNFGATVWNAGTSPLVVDGFRKGNADVMDAYQYFYDAKGRQTGYVRAGSMEWDGRPSHNHWHFEDFAKYTLLGADKKTVVVSEKEAFCLAATDAIDYTIPGADWHPWNTDLQTACGDHSSIAVSEVLQAGSGDTYTQDRAGQSFPLTHLNNGVYYIKVAANPAHVLTEVSSSNNVALRKVKVGGTTGHRTVYVYPVGKVTA